MTFTCLDVLPRRYFWFHNLTRQITVTVRFQAIGSAPQLRQKVFKVASANRFESVVAFLGRKLGGAAAAAASTPPGTESSKGPAPGKSGQQVFCYVNSVFAPGLDEGVGGLWKVSPTFLEGWRSRRIDDSVVDCSASRPTTHSRWHTA